MSSARLLSAACLTACAVVVLTTAQAGNVRIQGAGGAFSLAVKSLKETRWETVVRQQYDYSCGSAAVATLLTFHYELPTREEDVFQAMFGMSDKKKIRAEGFSMFDMKKYLDAQHLRSDGFRVTLDKFAEIGVPGITLINTNGYRHFVVIKGIEGDRILVGDPALGTAVVPRAKFETIWNGVVLAAREDVQTARQHFNQNRDWRVRPKAPVGKGVSRTGLGTFTLTLPGRNEFGR